MTERQPPVPSAIPIVNQDRFDLLTAGDAGLQQQLRSSFVRQAPAVREQLTAACAQGAAQFAEALHMLEGAGAFVAADALLALLGRAKTLGPDPDLGQRRELLAQILEGLRVLEAALVADSAGAAPA